MGASTHAITPAVVAGRYQLLRRLASGGMGEVHLARERGVAGFRRLVVVKRLLPRVAGDSDHVARFVDEARLVANLRHPNIVQVHDFGCDQGGFYLAMEYVPGRDLHSLIERAARRGVALPRSLAVYLVAELARGLHHAHTARDDHGVPLGIVHRDVTPPNVLLSFGGDVKLADFGVAKTRDAVHRTGADQICGKRGYMSPEQLDGDAVDARSDVFACGVILWELTVGGAPRGRRPRDVGPDYPEALDRIVATALARDPAARFASAAALVDALRDYARGAEPFDREDLARLMGSLFARELEAERTTPDTAPTTGVREPSGAGVTPLLRPHRRAARRAARLRRLAVIAGIVAATSVAAGLLLARPDPDPAQPVTAAAPSRLDEAWRAAGAHHFERARELVVRHLERHPDDGEARVLEVLVRWWTGARDFAAAAEALLAAEPPESHRLLVRGILLVHDGREVEAGAMLDRAADEHPGDAFVLYGLGEALWHAGERDRGAAALLAAFEADPRWQIALGHPVDLELASGTPADLAPVVARLAERDPAAAATLEARIAIAEGRAGDARQIATDALRAAPDAAGLWQQLAAAEAVLGDHAAAEPAARRAFELGPVDDRESGGFAIWTELALYRGDRDRYAEMIGARLTHASMLVAAFWDGAVEIGSPAPIRTDLTPGKPGDSRMVPPPLSAAVSLLGASRRGDPIAPFYERYPDAEVEAYGRGLDAERAGDLEAAERHFAAALAIRSSGELRMLLAYHLARVRRARGDRAGAAAACLEVIQPRVYQPYRGVLLRDCAAWRQDGA